MAMGLGSRASCVNGCQMESDLGAIRKILWIEIIAKDLQERLAIDLTQPGYPSNQRDGPEPLDGTFVVPIARPYHHHAFDRHFRATQSPDRKQSVIDRSQRGARRNNNRKSKAMDQIEHQLRIIDRHENSACAFHYEWPGETVRRLNPRNIDTDPAGLGCQVRRYRWIEAIRF